MSGRLVQLKALLVESPQDSFLWFAIAKEYEKQGLVEEALNFYQKLLQEAPDYVGTYYHLAKLYERKNQFAEAFQIYKKGIVVASQIGDHHARNELLAAKLNLGEDEDFE